MERIFGMDRLKLFPMFKSDEFLPSRGVVMIDFSPTYIGGKVNVLSIISILLKFCPVLHPPHELKAMCKGIARY